MVITMQITTQTIFIPGPVGQLEAILHTPTACSYNRVGVVCHPNPIQEGTMHNKVVTTIVRTFNQLSLACIRFNFRGVGQSAGQYGNQTGEIADCLAIINWIKQQWLDALSLIHI